MENDLKGLMSDSGILIRYPIYFFKHTDMKRRLLLVGVFFILLWATCLFLPDKTTNIYIAFIVALFFFIQYLVTKKTAVAVTESQNADLQHLINSEKQVVAETVDSEV